MGRWHAAGTSGQPAQLPPPATASLINQTTLPPTGDNDLPGGDLHGSSKGILVNCALPNQVLPLTVIPERV